MGEKYIPEATPANKHYTFLPLHLQKEKLL